jgi:hypothetical protein
MDGLGDRGDVFHTPDISLHLEEEGGVVPFMLLQLLTGIGKDTVFTSVIGLGEDGTKSFGSLVVFEAYAGD